MISNLFHRLKSKLRTVLELLGVTVLGFGAVILVGSMLFNNTTAEAAVFLKLVRAGFSERLLGYARLVEMAARTDAVRNYDLGTVKAYLGEIVDNADDVWSHFILTDATGYEVASTLEGVRPSSIVNQEYFYTPYNRGDTVIAEPLYGMNVDRRLIGIGSPVSDQGVTIGVLVGFLRLEYVSAVLDEQKITQNSYTFMMNSNGTISGHPNDSFILKRNWVNPPYGEDPPYSASEASTMRPEHMNTLKAMILGKSGYTLTRVDGVYSLITYMPMGIRSISLAMISPADELFRNSLLIALFMVSSLILLLYSVVTSRRLLDNVELNVVLRERAEAASLAKSTFLSNMSHEIRTPLNAVLGFTQLSRIGGKEENLQENLRHIENSSRHMLSIINDILDMSKIEAGKLEIARVIFSLKNCIEDINDIIQSSVAVKGVSYKCDGNSLEPYWVYGDDMRLKQVVLNLLSNAVKFTESGGSVNLTGSLIEERNGVLWIRFDVQDTGIGMSPEKMDRLFQPFEQGDDRTTRIFGGTGLGLAISKAIVEMMQGSISIASHEGEGSTFTVIVGLDRAEAQMDLKDEASDDQEGGLSGVRILLVDDVDLNREIVIEMLRDTGATFYETSNGQEAVDAFINSPEGYFDLVLMDVQMPVLDGYSASRLIRSAERGDANSICILALTANAFREDFHAAIEAGMDGHIAKPFDYTKLLSTVGEELHRKRKQEGAE